MKKFYFTFGYAHGNDDRYQVIYAKSEEAAYERMHEMYGNQFAFGYDAEQWARDKAAGFNKYLKPMKPEYAFAS